jgi:alkylation response protein AidB-like acyl-CoA dehydrogenase
LISRYRKKRKKCASAVRKWVQEECIPAEKEWRRGKPYKEVLAELRAKARAKGLWLPFFPVEHGGMGLGPLANALVQMELGQQPPWRPFHELPGSGRCDHADPAGPRHGFPERKIPETADQW